MAQYHSEYPPELKFILDKIQAFKRFSKGRGPQGSQGLIIFFVIILLIASFSSFYTIDPDESGVILRFGKYIDTTTPGLHFKLPFGVDKVYKVKTTTIRKEEFGFRTTKAGVVSSYSRERFDNESLMLTGDLNVADVEWIVQFKVHDPYNFLFKVRNVGANLRDVSESVMRLVVGDRTVNEILTTGRVSIADAVKVKMQEIYNLYGLGITVTNVILQDVNPPELVKDSFNKVNEAKQEQEKMVNQAWEEYNRAIPEEKGKAEETIAIAEGYALAKINRAKGEADRFKSIFREYTKAPNVTRLRMYLEKMQEVLAKADSTFIMDPAAKTLLPHLDVKKFNMKEEIPGGDK